MNHENAPLIVVKLPLFVETRFLKGNSPKILISISWFPAKRLHNSCVSKNCSLLTDSSLDKITANNFVLHKIENTF